MSWGPTIALDLAKANGNSEVAEFLESSGAGPILPRIPDDLAQVGDAERGRAYFETVCVTCHFIDTTAPPLTGHFIGPRLTGLLGRPVASVSDFDYSESLIAFGGLWSHERLFAFVLQPKLTVPGTKMRDQPMHDPFLAADLVAFFVSKAE